MESEGLKPEVGMGLRPIRREMDRTLSTRNDSRCRVENDLLSRGLGIQPCVHSTRVRPDGRDARPYLSGRLRTSSRNAKVGSICVAMYAGSSCPASGMRVSVEFAPALTRAS